VHRARGRTWSAVVPSLHLRGLSYAHTSATPILDRVDLDLGRDPTSAWIGVVGANGAGKTTLLRLLAGQLAPTAGQLGVQAEVPPLLVPQAVDAVTDEVRSFALTWDGIAEKLRSRLDLDPDDLDPALGRGWSALSPGQRKRWQVATAVAAEPDVLLLDEPTNHLDARARDLLLDVLAGFRGLGLVVSHDRTVLARLTQRTVRLHGGGLELHAGSYAEASARWRADAAARRDAHDRATREERRLGRQLADARRDRADTERGSAAARRRGTDPEARSMGARFRAQTAEQAHAKRVAAVHSRLERAHAEVAAASVERELGGQVTFAAATTGRRRLAAVSGDVAHAGGTVWLRDVDVVLHRGEKVHLRGANGAGKSSLLRALGAALAATSELVAALPQELDDPLAEVARVRALDPALRGRVLGVVALLGVDPDRVLVTDAPSPGEARKLALARLLAGDTSVLVLDEPTNHLDLPSIERLEAALRGWTGALVLVTHDDVLATAVTTTVWTVADRRVVVTTR
jgi:ATPase subunit of ABC transporter with duplicated ATPase domains